MAPADIAWQLALEAEVEVRRSSRFALVCWDLRSMYDMLGHRRLCARAVSVGMPWQLAIGTLATYRWPRVAVLDGVAARPIFPTVGGGV